MWHKQLQNLVGDGKHGRYEGIQDPAMSGLQEEVYLSKTHCVVSSEDTLQNCFVVAR